MKSKIYLMMLGIVIVLLAGWILLIRHAVYQHRIKSKKIRQHDDD
jgi:hypothetical protein